MKTTKSHKPMAPKPPVKHRVFMLDDHPMVREGTAGLINHQPDLVMVGTAGTATEAIAQIAVAKPDVVLADLSLEGRSGLEFIKDLKQYHPKLPVVVFTMHGEQLYAERSLRAGARGYVMKGEPTDNLLAALRQVLRGQLALSPAMSARLLASAVGQPTGQVRLTLEQLTDRELEIFEFRGRGLPASQIAGKLHLSRKTVDSHLENIKRKLGLTTAGEVLQRAVLWVASQQNL